MRLDARQKAYLAIRLGAAVVFLLAATVLPRGLSTGLLVMAAGFAAVLACIGVNAGGPGEQAGTGPQERWFDSVRAPQGDWPPYVAARAEEAERRARPAQGPDAR